MCLPLPEILRVDPLLRAVLLVEAPDEIEQARRDVDMTDHRLRLDAALRFVGIAHDEGHPQAALVDRRLSPGESHAVIGREDDERLIVDARLFEYLDKSTEPLVDARAGLVVLGEFLARFRGVREERWDRHFRRLEEHFLDSLVPTFSGEIAKEVGLQFARRGLILPAAAVGIGRGEVEEERLVTLRGDEVLRVVRHLHRIATGPFEERLEVVHLLGRDMVFTDVPGAISLVGEDTREERRAARRR